MSCIPENWFMLLFDFNHGKQIRSLVRSRHRPTQLPCIQFWQNYCDQKWIRLDSISLKVKSVTVGYYHHSTIVSRPTLVWPGKALLSLNLRTTAGTAIWLVWARAKTRVSATCIVTHAGHSSVQRHLFLFTKCRRKNPRCRISRVLRSTFVGPPFFELHSI